MDNDDFQILFLLTQYYPKGLDAKSQATVKSGFFFGYNKKADLSGFPRFNTLGIFNGIVCLIGGFLQLF
ncbi:hypothetical protein [Paenibacillus physcomitrellae]|uniref:hypothetical protein n=1 Tax=Paenibacillus physcomitrellae TaxID=1619311 RepID=UPI00157F9FA9|nr:hypothetical protein [Paenibacillus physcomitrellae]